jgi:hypothetical protein
MDQKTIETEFRKKVSEKIRLEPEGKNRYRVFTPFRFDDGDHLAIVLRKNGSNWELSDEGHTLMHLSYRIETADLNKDGNRRKLINKALARFDIKNDEGELVCKVDHGQYGDALFSFVQGLIQVFDVSFLSRNIVKSTFVEDLKKLIAEKVPEKRVAFDWSDPEKDPEGKYLVDCRINGMPQPLFVFAITNDDKCSLATITIHYYEKQGKPFRSLAVFENMEEMNVKAVARLTDVCGRQFSNLSSNRDRIAGFLDEALKVN